MTNCKQMTGMGEQPAAKVRDDKIDSVKFWLIIRVTYKTLC